MLVCILNWIGHTTDRFQRCGGGGRKGESSCWFFFYISVERVVDGGKTILEHAEKYLLTTDHAPPRRICLCHIVDGHLVELDFESSNHCRQRVESHDLGQQYPEERGEGAQNDATPAEVEAPGGYDDPRVQQRLSVQIVRLDGDHAVDGHAVVDLRQRTSLLALEVYYHQREQCKQS